MKLTSAEILNIVKKVALKQLPAYTNHELHYLDIRPFHNIGIPIFQIHCGCGESTTVSDTEVHLNANRI